MKIAAMIGAASVLAACGAASAQTGRLILEDYFGDFYVVQGGSVVQTITRNFHGNAEPFIVSGNSIFTSPMGGNGTGYEYDLGTGNIVNSYFVPANGGHHDAGFDGKTIYNSQNFCGSGDMWAMDAGWQNPQSIFTYSSNDGVCSLGTTWDPQNGWIWTEQYGASYLSAYDTSGNLQASFPVSVDGSLGLAYETETNTLWTATTYGGNEIVQFDKNGNELQRFTVNGLPGGIWHTAEFAGAIPAPGAAALLGLGALVGTRRRR